uniref:Odorant receptor n=1 Tax=Apolygus lucorum TaxID=248454 RepID=A0A1Q1NIJ8_APOLU|nr:olfactory receptor [Apolygus lucorum]
MTPEKFMGTFSVQHAILFSALFIFHTMYAIYEVTITAFFARSLLETVSHFYIATYLFAFNFQWYFMLYSIRTFHENEIFLEDFKCTQTHADFATRELDENVYIFTRVLFVSCLCWTVNSSTHIIGPAIEALISLIKTGQIDNVLFILPPVFSTPWWAQIIIYFCNAITMFGLLLYCLASYTIMGFKVLKLKTLCDILNEALRNDVEEESNIKAYIKDHQIIIKAAKLLNAQLRTLNGFMFTACYLEFAVQLFALTLIDPSGSYYFALALDLSSIFLILVFQCWMGTMITHSLETVANGVYESLWYSRGNNNRSEVILMTQMAQKPFVQTIWLGTLKVERATSLSLVRSSYAMYTLLNFFQDK